MAGVRQTQNGVVQTTGGVAQTVSGATIIDSFEGSNPLSPYDGSTAEFTVADESTLSFNAPDGSNVLEHTTADAFGRIRSTSGLSNYFSKGNVAKVAVRTTALENLAGVLFGVVDNNDRYEVQLRYSDDRIDVDKLDAGTRTEIAQVTQVGFSTDTWGTVTITWDDGQSGLGGSNNDITVEYAEGGSTLATTPTTNDSTHASADGIGFLAANTSSADIYHDYYRLP